MVEFVSDCPRCGASDITMDCNATNWIGVRYEWKNFLEAFVVCRRCHKGSIQVITQRARNEVAKRYLNKSNSALEMRGALNDVAEFHKYITLRDKHNYSPPEFIPENIKTIMEEANSCLASRCFNAAAAMYRLALDLATKSLLPEDGEPNSKIRRSLGLRIQWLIEKDHLPVELKELAECVQQDGNDGAHDGSVEKEVAEDLHDFSFELLRRLFTEPEKLRLAKVRRLERRGLSS